MCEDEMEVQEIGEGNKEEDYSYILAIGGANKSIGDLFFKKKVY